MSWQPYSAEGRVAGIEKRTSTFDLVAFTAENRRALVRKMLWLDWNKLGISRM
jgi:hypothetical protein